MVFAECRWDITAADQLPDYMKICFNALYNLTNEISFKVYQKHGWDPTDSLRKTVKLFSNNNTNIAFLLALSVMIITECETDLVNFLQWESLCKAFLVEAQWFASGKVPSAEEYLKNGIISSGVHIVLVHIFFLLGQGLTKENVRVINGIPGIISSTATILRLWDDLGNAEV